MKNFIFQFLNFSNFKEEYRGYWFENNSTNIKNKYFSINIEYNFNDINNPYLFSEVTLLNNSIPVFKPTKFPIYGIPNYNLSTIFLFRPRKIGKLSSKIFVDFILHCTNNFPLSISDNNSLIFENISKNLMESKNDQFFITFQLFKGYNSNFTSIYELNNTINGTLLTPEHNITLFAQQFNTNLLIDEGKIFGIINGIMVCILFLIWKYLFYNLKPSDYSNISPYSILFGNSYDFSFSHTFLEIGRLNSGFHKIYVIVFCGYMFLYFFYEIKFLMKTWKSNLNNRGLLEDNEIQDDLFSFLLFSTGISFLSLIFFNYLNSNSIFFLIFLFSNNIPQIWFSAKYNKKIIISIYIYLIFTFIRLIPIYYFFCYSKNILLIKNNFYFYIALIYSLIQILIIFLQIKFGSDFFIPKIYRIKPFDYYENKPLQGTECSICMSEINDNEVSVITPCKHSFHDECIRRWMEEQLICPICRRELPQMIENEL